MPTNDNQQPDELDLDELDRFLRSRAGQIYEKRVLQIAERHVKACQDRRASVEDIRASQGALEVVYAVMALPRLLQKELEKKKDEERSHGKK